MNKIFYFYWSQSLKISTLLFILLITVVYLWVAHITPDYFVVGRLLYLLLPLTVIGSYLFAPKSAALSNDAIIINRPVMPVRIKMASVKNIEMLNNADLNGALKLFGVTHMFGFMGFFKSKKLGRFIMYATKQEGYVLIEGAKKYIITPENPEDFVREANMHIVSR